ALREYVAALNRLYLSLPALYEQDFSAEGFRWLLPDEAERNLAAYLRRDLAGKEAVVVLTFSDTAPGEICLPTLREGRYVPVFCTEGVAPQEYYIVGADGRLSLSLPPRSGRILVRTEDTITL
ncbi:MAG: alpha amylase C-terminal domain-containing protein, partial [Clostridia bacterium]|nr:alpha amylase C-terminal domain-containing protein [Clostridia bacterium]